MLIRISPVFVLPMNLEAVAKEVSLASEWSGTAIRFRAGITALRYALTRAAEVIKTC